MFKLKEFHKNKEWAFALSLQTAREYYSSTPNLLRIGFFGYSMWFKVPEILKPQSTKVTIDGGEYTKHVAREYGFSLYKDALHIRYGIQPGCWSSKDPKNSDRSKVFFLPWNEQRRIHIDYLNPDGSLFERYFDNENGSINFDNMNRIRDALPKMKFKFNDYDGEENEATCYLETSIYRQGTSWCKFLGYIIPPKIYRKMDISFAKETGRQKGSWKGGTMGTSTDIKVGESPLEAFVRFGMELTYEKGHGKVDRGFHNMEIVDYALPN